MITEIDRENPNPGRANQKLGSRMVCFLRAWDAWERMRGREVIDMDLAPSSEQLGCPPGLIIERRAAIRGLRRYKEMADRSSDLGDRIYTSLDSCVAYAESLEGRHIAIEEYLKRTLGLAHIRRVSRFEIEDQFDKVSSLYNGMGYKYSDDGYKRFVNDQGLSRRQVIEEFRGVERWSTPIILKALGLPKDLAPHYHTEFVQVNDYWVNWASTSPIGSFLLRINTHPRHSRRWIKGIPERLAIHEIGGHFVQAAVLRNRILKEELSPFDGILTVPGPGTYISEGLASALPFLIPELYDKLSPYGKLSVEQAYLKDLVFNNPHLNLDNPKHSRSAIANWIKALLPNETDAEIERILSDRAYSPWHRSYLFSYSSGNRDFRYFAEQLSEKQRTIFVRAIYNTPMTPTQIWALFGTLRKRTTLS